MRPVKSASKNAKALEDYFPALDALDPGDSGPYGWKVKAGKMMPPKSRLARIRVRKILTPWAMKKIMAGLEVYGWEITKRLKAPSINEFVRLATNHGLDVIDMRPIFEASGPRYNIIPQQWPWNSQGHAVAADAIIAYIKQARLTRNDF